jgi:hypothetical protein
VRAPSVAVQIEAPGYLAPVLTDEEAEAIRRQLADGWRGPVLLRWLEQLLRDRDEQRQREREGEAVEPQQP